MDAYTFWNVIGNYNEHTLIIQIIMLVFVLTALVLSYSKKTNWAAKFALGIINLYIGIAFFALFGTEPIQFFLALPLFLLCGILFLYEAWHNHDDILQTPNVLQVALLSLYGLYPLVSVIFGNSFPQMVTYIMPCPIISLSIVVYAGYQRKSKLLIFLMTIWGLTGIKSLFFNAYEDLILLACGIYGIMMFTTEVKRSKKKQ